MQIHGGNVVLAKPAAMQVRQSTHLFRVAIDEIGTAAVEFGLTIPVVLTLIFGIIDCARLTFSQAALNFAAGEATRYAVVREGQVSDDDIQTFAEQQMIDAFGLGGATFRVDTPLDEVSGTSIITVVGTYDFSFLLPFLPPDLIRLSSESRGFLAFPGNPGGGVGEGGGAGGAGGNGGR